MRVRALLIFVFLASLGGCMLPRPWLGPGDTHMCPDPQPVAGEQLLLISFRLPDCRQGTLKWTAFRSEQPHFGVADATRATRRVPEEDWWNDLDARVRGTGKAPVIYIHGYFNSQDDAVRRGLGMRALLCPRETTLERIVSCVPVRPVVALSWPSYDDAAKYTWDEANSEWAVDHATAVILQVARKYPGTILVAHSMGNRILVPATLAAAREGLRLEHVVLASPDVDRAYLARLLGRAEGLGFPATIYASRKDQALSASWRTHGHPRAGDLSNWVSGRNPGYPYREFRNSEIVDTTGVSAGAAAHAAFIKSEEGAADLCHVLAGDEIKPGRLPDTEYPPYSVLRKGVPPGDDCRLLAWAATRIAESKPLRQR